MQASAQIGRVPPVIWLALVLLLVAAVLTVASSGMQYRLTHELVQDVLAQQGTDDVVGMPMVRQMATMGLVFGLAVGLILRAVFAVAIYRGLDWGRWALLALVVYGLFSAVTGMVQLQQEGLALGVALERYAGVWAILLAGVLLELMAVVLLFVPSGRAWFERHRTQPAARVAKTIRR